MSKPRPGAPSRHLAQAHYEELERLTRALGSSSRLRLLDLLRQAPRSVELLAKEAGLSVANASQHLKALRTARLVEAQKLGKRVVYRVASSQVSAMFMALRALAETQLPEMDRLRSRLGALSSREREELLGRIDRRRVTLLDVRPEEEHRAGHLPGAVSIPLAELGGRLQEIPRAREVVAYCRGPYCTLAQEAVAVLRAHGFRAQHLDLGAADLPARKQLQVAEGGVPPRRKRS